MAEYIDRSAGVSIFRAKANMAVLMDAAPYFEKAAQMLEKLPAADVAEVVRCRNCAAWKRNVGIADSPNGHCFEHDIETNGQDFCSYGEYQTNTWGNGNVSD